jgi:hypothetical protein
VIDDDDDRCSLASGGTPESRHAHLEPIVSAELRWGNSIQYGWRRVDPLLDDRSLRLARPFHVEQLRKSFRFPPNISLTAVLPRPGYRERGRLILEDANDFVAIDSPLPDVWPYGAGQITLPIATPSPISSCPQTESAARDQNPDVSPLLIVLLTLLGFLVLGIGLFVYYALGS